MPSGMAVSNRGSLAPNLSYRLAIQAPARSGISSDQARTSNCFELTTFTKAEPTNRDPLHASRPRRSKTTKPLPRKILRLRHPGFTPFLLPSAAAQTALREGCLTACLTPSGTSKTPAPHSSGTYSDTPTLQNRFDRPIKSPFCTGAFAVPFTLRTSRALYRVTVPPSSLPSRSTWLPRTSNKTCVQRGQSR